MSITGPRQGSGDLHIEQDVTKSLRKEEKKFHKGSASFVKSVSVKEKPYYTSLAKDQIKAKYIKDARLDDPEFGEKDLKFVLSNPKIRDMFNDEVKLLAEELEADDKAKDEKIAKQKVPRHTTPKHNIGEERVSKAKVKENRTTKTADQLFKPGIQSDNLKEKDLQIDDIVIVEKTEAREMPKSTKPMIEEAIPLDPHSIMGIAERLDKFSKSNNTNKEYLKLFKETLKEAEREIKRLGVIKMDEKDLFQLDLDTLRKTHTLRTSVGKVAFIEDNGNAKLIKIKKKAKELKGKIPDAIEAVSVKEMKTNVAKVSQFYEASAKLYGFMSETKFPKDAEFDIELQKTETFQDLLNFKKDIAKKNVDELIPNWNKEIDDAQPGKKGTKLSSGATRGLTEGIGSESETLLKYAHTYLSNLPKPGNLPKSKKVSEGINEANHFLEEIEGIRNLMSQTKKETGQDITPWALHQMGRKDMIDFQNRLMEFVSRINNESSRK